MTLPYHSIIVIISFLPQNAIMTSESYYTPIAIDPKSNIVDHYNIRFECRNWDIFQHYEHHFDEWYETIHNSVALNNYTNDTTTENRKKYYTYIYFGKYYCTNIVITDLEDNGEVYNVKITADYVKTEELSNIEASFEQNSILDCAIKCRDRVIDMNTYVNREYLQELREGCNIEYAMDHM